MPVPVGPPPPAPLLVGQAPSRSASDLLGGSGARIARLAGLSLEQYESRLARVNLLEEWPGRVGDGDALPPREARAAWRALIPELAGRRRVVLLGRGVARAAGLDGAPWWSEVELEVYGRRAFSVTLAVVPHPSGVSRWWNDPVGVLRARAWWRELVRSSEGGSWGDLDGGLRA